MRESFKTRNAVFKPYHSKLTNTPQVQCQVPFTFFFFFFLGLCLWHMEVPRLGVKSELAATGLHHSRSNAGSKPGLQPTPQLMANTESPIHWAKPGVKPTSPWILVGFVFLAPLELPHLHFKLGVLSGKNIQKQVLGISTVIWPV